ncbi:DNA replication protein [Murine herpesvirus strain 4556]|uniref:59 protein n=2 Tax=Orthoherpesviridae TaxID=3044472 RepID=P88996_MHV68|nr:DNA replication protein [Murid gammaherpesvirus 4]AXP99139.1 DNA replication protein [synthetic construct]QJQ80245.1 DNA replication protein [Murine herpesvirus]UNZ86688.1 DNA replication protein [Murine herpesvirus strain 72]UNZ86765.1 DNA replication protein [Murine herpesvirus strain 4556]AAB66449.1 DNA replication protein [Murid gammaherpesvirus 4]
MQTFQLDTERLCQAAKLYQHTKSDFGLNGMIQLSGSCNNMSLSVLGSIGGCAILRLELLEAARLHSSKDSSKSAIYSFRNASSLGREFTHGGELFGPKMESASLSFYGHHGVKYVEAQFVHDSSSKTVHTAAMQPITIPPSCAFDDREANGIVTLSTKTAAALVKWLKQHTKTCQSPVKVSISEILGVMVLSVGDASMTVDVTPVNVSSGKKTRGGNKASDSGTISADATVHVNGHCLIRSLIVCKVPGCTTPRVKFHACGILEVDGAPVKQGELTQVKLSVALLNVDSSTGRVLKEPVVTGASKDRGASKSEDADGSPPVPDHPKESLTSDSDSSVPGPRSTDLSSLTHTPSDRFSSDLRSGCGGQQFLKRPPPKKDREPTTKRPKLHFNHFP